MLYFSVRIYTADKVSPVFRKYCIFNCQYCKFVLLIKYVVQAMSRFFFAGLTPLNHVDINMNGIVERL